MHVFAYFLFGVGALVSLLNIYRAFFRPTILRLLQREYRRDLVVPLIGSLFLVLCLVYFQLPQALWWTAVILALLDTGGIHWAIVRSLRQARAEDERRRGNDSVA
jgi:hypothetical protein